MAEQNFANHTCYVPLYHGVTLGILVLNLGYSIYKLAKTSLSFEAIVGLLLAVALILIFFHARLFALTVQDRVIRIEMRLRMERVLPGELKSRIGEFNVAQLVSLRFASDAELPELARRVLEEKLTGGKAIKQLVKNWQADTLRA